MKCSFLSIVTLLLTLTAFGQTNSKAMNDTQVRFNDTLNLRRIIDPASGKRYIDTFLEKAPDYPFICNELNFIFKKKYAHFELTRTRVFLNHNTVHIEGWFNISSNKRKEGIDVSVQLYFYETKKEALEYMRNSLDTYSAPSVYQSSIVIGDFAIGDVSNISFVRGNVVVHVIGHFVVSEKLSREIDEQILNIINGNTTRKNAERCLEKASDRVFYDLIHRRNEYIDFEINYLDFSLYDEQIVAHFRLKGNDREVGSYDANVLISFVNGTPQVDITKGDINNLEKIIHQQIAGF